MTGHVNVVYIVSIAKSQKSLTVTQISKSSAGHLLRMEDCACADLMWRSDVVHGRL